MTVDQGKICNFLQVLKLCDEEAMLLVAQVKHYEGFSCAASFNLICWYNFTLSVFTKTPVHVQTLQVGRTGFTVFEQLVFIDQSISNALLPFKKPSP